MSNLRAGGYAVPHVVPWSHISLWRYNTILSRSISPLQLLLFGSSSDDETNLQGWRRCLMGALIRLGTPVMSSS